MNYLPAKKRRNMFKLQKIGSAIFEFKVNLSLKHNNLRVTSCIHFKMSIQRQSPNNGRYYCHQKTQISCSIYQCDAILHLQCFDL